MEEKQRRPSAGLFPRKELYFQFPPVSCFLKGQRAFFILSLKGFFFYRLAVFECALYYLLFEDGFLL